MGEGSGIGDSPADFHLEVQGGYQVKAGGGLHHRELYFNDYVQPYRYTSHFHHVATNIRLPCSIYTHVVRNILLHLCVMGAF